MFLPVPHGLTAGLRCWSLSDDSAILTSDRQRLAINGGSSPLDVYAAADNGETSNTFGLSRGENAVIEKEQLRSALQILLDGKTLEERVDRGQYVPDNEPADPVLRELQKLGVSLTIHQQMLGDCLARVYSVPRDKHSTAKRIFANLKNSKPRAKIKA